MVGAMLYHKDIQKVSISTSHLIRRAMIFATMVSCLLSQKQHMSKCSFSFKANGSHKNVQVGKDQEKAQSEKDSHSKNRAGKKPNQ